MNSAWKWGQDVCIKTLTFCDGECVGQSCNLYCYSVGGAWCICLAEETFMQLSKGSLNYASLFKTGCYLRPARTEIKHFLFVNTMQRKCKFFSPFDWKKRQSCEITAHSGVNFINNSQISPSMGIKFKSRSKAELKVDISCLRYAPFPDWNMTFETTLQILWESCENSVCSGCFLKQVKVWWWQLFFCKEGNKCFSSKESHIPGTDSHTLPGLVLQALFRLAKVTLEHLFVFTARRGVLQVILAVQGFLVMIVDIVNVTGW